MSAIGQRSVPVDGRRLAQVSLLAGLVLVVSVLRGLLNFVYAVESGRFVHRQIVVDPRVKGTITVYSDQPLSVREAYLNYLSALRGLGFAVVENAGLLKVVPEAGVQVTSTGPSTRSAGATISSLTCPVAGSMSLHDLSSPRNSVSGVATSVLRWIMKPGVKSRDQRMAPL